MWWWEYTHDGPGFTWLGTAHIMVIVSLIVACMFIIVTRRWWQDRPQRQNAFRFSCVGIFVVGEILLQVWYIQAGVWDASFALPLHLSSIAWIAASFMLITRGRTWFEITFFAGVGSAFLTILTPDVGNYGFPHFRFFHFFITHALVIVAVVYMLAVENMQLRFRSVFKVWLYLNGYAAMIVPFNFWVDGNYMYLMDKPSGPSPFDWLGPWPYYIFSLQAVALFVFIVMYGIYRSVISAGSKRSPRR
ncbi:putative integral membrane protein (TIGR02206 family) [Geomicrobium halophilum]|uniref:Putative integral membrane protein (TIGR02206 family) n=1 Tax=Geomicrobium halophilum TaxID=549000 RepID=A0A841PWN9_9BACL|nr:TIGR02206 family membrane protein [Geomicrobium halophilum]MBB6448422.1 putative integral membrane protein (TIGR02206 family) [Geomicrobium halophilum]